jgi:hypothetical protein
MFIAPENLSNIDKSHADRVITGRKCLLGPIPYRGGDIEIELGLFSIRSGDLAGPFLKVLESMALVPGVSSVNTAIPFVRPILEGVNELFGATNTILEVGRNETLNKPKTGYFVVMRAQTGTIDIPKLKLEKDGRLYDPNSNEPVGYPYMVYHIQALDRRDEWFKIPELFNAHKKIMAAVRDCDVPKADEAFTSFKIIVSTSPDLISDDASTLITEVQRDLREIFPVISMDEGLQQQSIETLHKPKPMPMPKPKPKPAARLRELSEIDLYSSRKAKAASIRE